MKLHLPTSLLAAVTLAFLGAQQSAATTSTTTEYNGKTYSGFIFKPTTVNAKYSDSIYEQVGTAVNGDTQSSGATDIVGNAMINNVGGSTGTTDNFYNYYFSNKSNKGNTFLLSTQTEDKTLTTDTSVFGLGGLITEASDKKWTLGRNSNNTSVTLVGNSSGVNLTIGANTELLAASNQSIIVETGGDWDIASGKTLTLNAPTITLHKGQTVDITRTGDSGVATVALQGNFAVATSGSGAATLNIGEGVTIAMADNKNLNLNGITYSNEGAIDLGSGSTLQLAATNGYTAGTSYTVGALTSNGTALSGDITSYLAGLTERQSASYSGTSITVSGTAFNLNWSATEDNTSWTAATGAWTKAEDNSAQHFVVTDNVTFGADAASKQVVIDGDITAGNIKINDDYTFDVTANSTISGAFSMTEGKTLTKTGSATLTLGNSATGSISTLRAEEGNIQLNNANLNISKLEIEGGKVAFGGGQFTHITQTHIKNGGTLEMSIDTYLKCNDIIIDGGGVLFSHSKRDLGTPQGTISINATKEQSAILKGNLYGSLWLKSNITGKGTLEVQHCCNGHTNSIDVYGVISDGTTGAYAGTLSFKQSSGETKLRNTNTYTGGTSVTGGKLTVMANKALGTGEVVVNGGTLEVDGTARTLDNTIKAGDETNPVATIGAAGATYKNLSITSTGVAGVSETALAEISGADVKLAGTFNFTNAKLTNIDFTATAAAGLTNSNVSLEGANTLTLDGAYTLSDNTISAGVLAGMTLKGSLTVDFSTELLNSVVAGLGEGNTLTISLGNITLDPTEAVSYSTDGAQITVSDALVNAFGEYTLDTDTGINLVFKGKEAAAIPEPTTATLSLLALAGLAARRRRK